ncbi:MAG: NADH-quinone oxidoreductase subunit A [Thermoguttaceae bacterium]
MDSSVLPIFLMLLCSLGLALGMLAFAHLLTRGRRDAIQEMPYESGMDPIHDTHRRFDVRFYLLSIAFLVFDVELLFLVPWAVAFGGAQQSAFSSRPATAVATAPGRSVPASVRSGGSAATAAGHGRAGDRDGRAGHVIFFGAMVFLLLLAVGYAYDWRNGVFQWR